MKKIILSAIVCLAALTMANAQDKAKVQYLPKAGDWALGIDVMPLLKYVGNAFNGNTDNVIEHLGGTPFNKNNDNFTITPEMSIMGKYMLSNEWALRGNVGIMLSSNTNRIYVQDDKAILLDPLSEDKNIDKIRTTKNGMSIALGAEYRKGSKRVQGVFGFGVLFAFQNGKSNYEWGNEMSDVNQQPSISDNYYAGYRLLEYRDNNANYYTGLTGSAGIEWFVCPKISLGAEVNLAAYYLSGAQSYAKSEGYNTSTNKVEERTDLFSPGNKGFYFGTESLGGSLNMTFYF